MKILIAEDEKISRKLLEATLASRGFEVSVAENGAQAWSAMQNDYFPVLITDFQMPGMDGYELSRRIRSANFEQYTYIILLTTVGSNSDYFGAISAGVDDFHVKPFDESLLAARLHVAERIVGLRQHARRLERLLPICCYCKKIRDDETSWQEVETYLHKIEDFKFSHTYCPCCYTDIVAPQLRSLGEVTM